MAVIPPIDDRLVEFKFPHLEKRVLHNGLSLIVFPPARRASARNLARVYFQFGFDFGEKHDPAGKEGAVELLSQVLKKGAAARTYDEIVEQVEFVGGSMQVDSTQDFFYLRGSFLSEYYSVGLELLSDIVLNPALHADEVEKERSKLLADIENEKSSPAFLGRRRLKKALYSPHPYALSKTPESVSAISREDIAQLHQKLFDPAKAFLIIAGDISVAEAEEKTIQFFGHWERKPNRASNRLELPERMPERRLYVVNRPDSEQCSILLGLHLFQRQHPDYEKFQVMNKILGGGAGARLFMKLREEKGYTYGAYSHMECYKEAGAWQASADVRTEVVDGALETFFEEMERVKEEPVGEEELKNARRYFVGSFPIRNEAPASIASLEMQKRLLGLPEDYWETYLKKIDRVSGQDISQMARTYLDQSRTAVVVVGDAKKIEKALHNYGKMEIYDLDDKRVG